MSWYASQMSCMSPYSMPLWTIFTKWPAPFSPTQSQQGEPSSTLAQIAWKMGLTNGHAAGEPPGIREGPFSAPSSPPETPQPTYSRPLLSTYSVRRMVSGKWLLPPSMRMSPGSRMGRSWSMRLSTACPALTIIMIFRGLARLSANSWREYVPMMFLPLARPSTNFVTFSVVRLNTATVKPLDSMFITRFSPMTARPTRPMSAFFMSLSPFFISAHGRCPRKYPRSASRLRARRSRSDCWPPARRRPSRIAGTSPAPSRSARHTVPRR